MKLLKTIIAVVLLQSTLLSFATGLDLHQRWLLRGQKLDSLALVHNVDDSIRLLYDAFDLSSAKGQESTGMMLLDLSEREKRYDVFGDVVAEMAFKSAANDSILQILMPRVSHLPISELKKELIAFMCMMRNAYVSRYASETHRQNILQHLIKSLATEPLSDIYDRIVINHAVCCNLAQSFRGDMMDSYFKEFEANINALPADRRLLRSMLDSFGGILYGRIYKYDESIKYHERLLNNIDSIEDFAKKNGHPLRDFSSKRFETYLTLMQNYPALSGEQMEEYYSKEMSYAATDSDAMFLFKELENPTIYYLMAMKRYKEVIPILKRQVDVHYNLPLQRRFMRYLMEASKATGDNETLLDVAMKYNNLLEDVIDKSSYERYKELQVAYDVFDLRSRNDKLKIEQKNATLKVQQRAIVIGVVSLILLVAFLIVVSRLYFKSRRLSKELVSANESLKVESDNLKKTQTELISARDEAIKASRLKSDFINNISSDIKVPLHAVNEYSRLIVDCTDEEKKPYLDKFARLIEFNGELLTTIVNDMLHLSELENSTVTLSYGGVDVNQVCNLAVDTVAHRVNPGVTICFTGGKEGMTLSSDRRRIEQVLVNLLSNAAKFTESGSIELGYELDTDKNRILFSVTDTGCGVPADKSEVIFDRFVKLDRHSPGVGLGLTISRLLAHILGGDVWLDKDYRRGARFYFSVPFNRN